MTTPLRVLFAGTPDFAASHLHALLDSEHEIVAVYSQPDRPAGRGKKLRASPVKMLAQEAGIPVEQPLSLRDEEAQATLATYAPDVMVVVAYGLILPQAVLDIPRMACLNVHASVLPRWRGAAPIQRAIEAGDTETGVTIMRMEAGLDTGPMLRIARCPIAPNDNAGTLHDRLAELGPSALLEVLTAPEQHLREAESQDDALANYATKIEKAEALVDWTADATRIDLAIRAFNPFPVAFTGLGGERLKIWAAEPTIAHGDTGAAPGTILSTNRDGVVVACGSGELRLTRLQLPGGKPLPVGDLLNARAEMFSVGTVLTAL